MGFDPGIPLLEHLSKTLPTMRPSERRVADIVADNPAFVVDSTMASVADAAGVSQPTVMRFSTSLGFDGFQQFKMALAQSLALGMPATLSTIQESDSIAELSTKIFDHSISSLDRARRYLEPAQIAAAVDAIMAAQSLIFTGLGASGIIALDAQQKSALFGLPCTVPSDPHQQFMAAMMATPGDVLFAISNTGETASVLQIAQAARDEGATVVAITGSSERALARIAHVTIVAKTFEDTDTFTPTVSRLAGLVVIDILATAVSLRRGQPHAARLASMKERLATFRRSQLD